MERIKNLFVFLWLLFLPTQLGLHFWPEWSHVMGLRIDYLSPILYFVDLIWVVMVTNLGFKNVKNVFNFKNVLILLFVLVNVIGAGNRWEAAYKWVRIWQWFLTFNIILQNKKIFKEMLLKVLPVWIIGEGLLSVAQVINGGSLNGIFYWLGERRFSYASLGVAQISYMGQGMIRAYGTFSHPNSLAGFVLVSLVLFCKRRDKNIIYWIVVFCGLMTLLLSGSRTVWGITIALIIFNLKFLIFNQFKIYNLKKIVGILLIFGGVVVLLFSLINFNYRITDFVGGWDSEGLAKRGGLIIASLKMIKDHPLFGVGAGNFLDELPGYQRNSGVFWLQPVHNIVFLIISEVGILGIFLLYLLLIKIKVKRNLIVLGIILITGMVDHYWITLPQNSWLMCVVLGLL
ncbi:MAG: O-antigen ligase family protein [Candidatus Shapirobacteria bacterium]